VGSGAVDLVNTNNFASGSGLQCIDLNADRAGAIYQDIATSSGTPYTLRFAFGGNTGCNPELSACGPQIKRMEVRWNGALLAALEHDITGWSPTLVGWREFSFTVTGSGMARLSFHSLTSGAGGPAIDDVSLRPADELPDVLPGLTAERAVQVCWPTTAGASYQVQWAFQLETNVWHYSGLPIVGDGATNCIYDPLGTNRMRIYRVLRTD
jgi:hypothetical protein